MAYEDYHVNADDVKLDGDPNIRRTVPPSPSSSGGGISYGTCTTAANVAEKVVILADASGWELKQGASVAVKFSYTNSYEADVNDPVQLNVNNSGAKNIYYGDSANPTGTNPTAFGRANCVNTYVYDGAYWVWAGSCKDGDSTNYLGAKAAWDLLSSTIKAQYLTMDFIDDDGFGDISDEDVTFTSSDVVDADADSWTVVSPIASGTTLNTLFSRVSQMFKNIRYLHNSAPPIGTINAFGGTTAPDGWLLCQGQAISRTNYSELFSVIGTNFGAGDGSTTFNVPDLRGEFLRGAGTNSHNNQGNGGTVGQHQDATESRVFASLASSTDQWIGLSEGSGNYKNADKTTANVTRWIYGQGVNKYSNSQQPDYYSSRPTNTSVNFIIRTK